MKIIVDKLPETPKECPFLGRRQFGYDRDLSVRETENRCILTMRECTRFCVPSLHEDLSKQETTKTKYQDRESCCACLMTLAAAQANEAAAERGVGPKSPMPHPAQTL